MPSEGPAAEPAEGPNTFDLLERWRQGDSDALGVLLDRDIEWIKAYIRRHLGDHLRRGADTDDFVQETSLAVLEYGPRFVIESRSHFRGLLAKITLNVLRARHREVYALKRTPERERSLGSGSVLYLDAPHHSVTRPDSRVADDEEREWVRLALLLLDARDQEIIGMYWDGAGDPDIADRLGIQPNTARMRRSRACGRLTKVVLKLKHGQFAELVEARPAAELGDG